jgi:hypothetical protein
VWGVPEILFACSSFFLYLPLLFLLLAYCLSLLLLLLLLLTSAASSCYFFFFILLPLTFLPLLIHPGKERLKVSLPASLSVSAQSSETPLFFYSSPQNPKKVEGGVHVFYVTLSSLIHSLSRTHKSHLSFFLI